MTEEEFKRAWTREAAANQCGLPVDVQEVKPIESLKSA